VYTTRNSLYGTLGLGMRPKRPGRAHKYAYTKM
jgi:hypothetical protein